jgi:hypothetical protein
MVVCVFWEGGEFTLEVLVGELGDRPLEKYANIRAIRTLEETQNLVPATG